MNPHQQTIVRLLYESKQTKNKYKPWFGIEQEYFIFTNEETYKEYKENTEYYDGYHYCGCGRSAVIGREIAEEHLDSCMKAGIHICGINGEVARAQWNFKLAQLMELRYPMTFIWHVIY